MLSLEPEFVRLRDRGEIAEEPALSLIAVERGALFSLHHELRVLLYLAVTLIASGVGLFLARNLSAIPAVAAVLGVGAAGAGCYALVWRRRGRPSVVDDYVLLLGALLLSADLGYAEAQYHLLGGQWSWHLLALAIGHGAAAYVFGSPFVLSASIAALAGFFGVHAGLETATGSAGGMLGCAAVLLGWRAAHVRLTGVRSGPGIPREVFVDILDHAAAMLLLLGSVLLVTSEPTRILGTLALAICAVAVVRVGYTRRRFAFVVYAALAGAVGIGYLLGEVARVPESALLAYVATVTVALTALLFRAWRRLRGPD